MLVGQYLWRTDTNSYKYSGIPGKRRNATSFSGIGIFACSLRSEIGQNCRPISGVWYEESRTYLNRWVEALDTAHFKPEWYPDSLKLLYGWFVRDLGERSQW